MLLALIWDNPLRFRKNLPENIKILIVEIDDKIRNEKLHYDVNRKVAKYHHYHKVKLINMNTLQVKKYYVLLKEE